MRGARAATLLVSVSLAACAPVFSPAEFGEPISPREQARMYAEAYDRAARSIAALPDSFRIHERAARHGIDLLDVLGDASARSRPGAPDAREPTVGLEVRLPGLPRSGARSEPLAVLAPTFRSPAAQLLEVRAERLFLRVGNHHGEELHTVSLREFLSDLGRYVSSPASLTGPASLGERIAFAAPADTHVYVEVLAAVVPMPVRGRVAVRPVFWSSTSAPHAPAFLTVVASAEGTSVRAIENLPGDRSLLGSGQALDFNDGGDRRAFGVARRPLEAITVIQVPLVSGQISVRPDAPPTAKAVSPRAPGGAPATPALAAAPSTGAPVPYLEGSSDRIERDESRPLRATVILLYPVAGGDLTDADWESIAGRLRAVSVRPDLAGALTLPETDARRGTF